MRGLARGSVLVAGTLVVAAFAAPHASAAAPVPTYATTIGGPGHADMYPSGLAVDSSGTVYAADTGEDEVKAFAPGGLLLWTAGARGAKQLGVFKQPRDVAYLNGKLYVDDTGNNRVQVLDATTGIALSQWAEPASTLGITAGVDGTGNAIILVALDTRHMIEVRSPVNGSLIRTVGTGPGSGNGQLNGPRDAATDSQGNIYVADYANQRVAKFSPTGVWLLNWGTLGSGPGQFQQPYGVAVDSANHVYIADSNNERIQKFTTTGAYLATYGGRGAGAGQFDQLRRVAVGTGSNPDVYGADLWDYKIERFNQAGVWQQTFGGTPPPLGLFNRPGGFDVDASNVFVADTLNQRFQRFGPSGAFQLTWGHRGWGADLLGVAWPQDIATNATTGDVYVCDTRNNRIIEASRGGVPTGVVLAGKRGSAIGQLNYPFAVASVGGDLIVADTNNNRVQRWNIATRTVVWTATGFNAPKAVSVSGNVVYVADTLNKRIVKLNASDGSQTGVLGVGVLHSVTGVAVEANGDVWISDTSWNRLVELDAAGNVLQKFGAAGTAHGQFENPGKLVILNHQLYVDDNWNDRIEVFDLHE